jgi:RNA polymerase sigma-70 factor (ECF subfamily)
MTSKAMDRVEMERQIEDLHPASFAWALGCCRRNRDDAEEVLQNVYVMLFNGKARFDGRSTLKTWLFAVIRRAAIAYRRRNFLRITRLARFFAAHEDDVADADAPRAIEQSERATRLASALLELPPRQREVVELVFYHDMTVESAAAVMETSVGSARVHYDRAKKRLRARLLEETNDSRR